MRKILAADKINPEAQKAIEGFYPEVIKEIEGALIGNEWVIVGMKQNPVVKKARGILSAGGVSFKYIEHGSYFVGWKLRLAIKLYTGWPTFPQVFHKGILIGGASDLEKYFKKS
jgi:glutaredoxin-related protein